MAKHIGLGRGLEALFEANEIDSSGKLMTLRVTQIEPNRAQPRTHFDETALAELADSIKQHGIIQPIVVRSMPDGMYQIVAGERRWRAARIAQLAEIPAMVMELSEDKQMQLAMIENLQREDLTPLEEAAGYKTLIEKHSLTQEQLAEVMGKSRPVITNSLRLLSLPDDVKNALVDKKITAAHARTLAGLDNTEDILTLLGKLLSEPTSVRKLEQEVKLIKNGRQAQPKSAAKQTPQDMQWGSSTFRTVKEIEAILQESLSTKVRITSDGGKGKLTIDFSSTEHLRQLSDILLSKNL